MHPVLTLHRHPTIRASARRWPLVPIVLLSALAACDAPAPSEPASSPSGGYDGLTPAVRAPALTQDDLTETSAIVHAPDPTSDGSDGSEAARPDLEDGPARATLTRPLQQVTNARTGAGFGNGYAYAVGRNYYVGNVGAISTTAHVTYGDKHVGSHTAQRQDYTPFLLDFGTSKFIFQHARVYSSHECGLTVGGESTHRAWWQFFQGNSVAAWGVDIKSTQARPAYQSACRTGTGGGTTQTESSSGLVCSYYITYDLRTGVILQADLLGCATVDNELV